MRRLKRVLLLGLSLLFLTSFMLYFLQEKLIFLPTKLPIDHTFSFQQPFKEFFLESSDGAKLNALHFTVDEPKGLILYFHGNAGDLSRWGEIVSPFGEFGYDVVVMDYRGYGKSTGNRSEQVLYNDAQLFYDYVLKHYPESELLIYGRSLGASIATHVASKNKPNKLILETPFYNLLDVAEERFGFLPLKTILNYKMKSNEYIQHVQCPVYIFHGTMDQVVSHESGKKLFESIPHDHKAFFSIKGGGHNNLDEFEAYWQGIKSILE
ncbi:alpha/beta fold hydrolase [Muricauda sp. JGD-17]|uniref:Alpha/beta fold hydrolase n=1 Tax=Flagellimonas ochracea TaxID=2696472 RepID=A0A964TA05_9FLAO|nr:alpha/beta fold hydrolase [Allomuricauda ochracea]NAY90990.1 alpha/beta fold hydrolase [Allomuricauda ochracea]